VRSRFLRTEGFRLSALYAAVFALSVVILANFLRDVPNELFESMRVDGAGHWRMLWSLVLPMVKPAVVTVAVYDGLNVWNGFLFPLILTQSADQRVLPMALWAFQGQFRVNIPAVLAAVILSTIPVLARYVLGSATWSPASPPDSASSGRHRRA